MHTQPFPQPPTDAILHGNSLNILPALLPASIDFILTDPPYIAHYTDRSGRSGRNDDTAAWLKPAYAEMFRVLKRDAFTISFYGWPKADLFLAAWKSAGFRIAGHMVFRKPYTSRRAFLQYRHEQAYLLVKGRPAYPDAPLPQRAGHALHRQQAAPDAEAARHPEAPDRQLLQARRSRPRSLRGIGLDPGRRAGNGPPLSRHRARPGASPHGGEPPARSRCAGRVSAAR